MTAAGWFPDPVGRYELRWWDGSHWTGDVVQHGQTTVDPWPVETAGVQATHPADPSPIAPTMPLPTSSPGAAPPVAPLPPPGSPGGPVPTAPAQFQVPPAAQPPMQVHPLPAAAPPPANSNRTALLVGGGVVAGLALVVGGFLLLGGDDESTAPASSTTVPATTVVATTVPGSTLPPTSAPTTTAAAPTTATVAPTTAPAADPTAALLAAMPGAGEVPDDWVPFDEPGVAEPDDDAGYCVGPNWAAQAISSGAEGGVHGPNWDLPDGGWFGLSAFTFPTPEAASAFVTNIDLQANGCMTDPVNYTVPEAEMDLFVDGDGDDAVWNVAETNGSFPGASPVAEEMTLVIYEEFISTTDDGSEYSVVRTEFQRFERYGRTVIAFWLWGEHDQTGFSGTPDWAYTPTEAALDGAAAVIRDLVLERLAQTGLR